MVARRWRRGEGWERREESVAVEEPLELRVEGRSVAVVMRTPGHDRELAAGFLLTEGILRSPEDLLELTECRQVPGGALGNVVDALLRRPERVDFERLTRHVFSSSSCGICGKASLEAALSVWPRVEAVGEWAPDVLAGLPAALRAAQPGYGASGGLHAAALLGPDGTLGPVREDVGRHNAVDKVIGRAWLDGRVPLTGVGLVVSGRVAYELVQKAWAAGLGLVAGFGAPTSLAVEAAAAAGIRLVGWLREDRLTEYTVGTES